MEELRLELMGEEGRLVVVYSSLAVESSLCLMGQMCAALGAEGLT